MRCKFWLDPIRIAGSHGFRMRELNRIKRIVERNQKGIMELWNAHCRPE